MQKPGYRSTEININFTMFDELISRLVFELRKAGQEE